MTESLQPIRYAESTLDQPTQCMAVSRLPFKDTLGRLKEAIKAEDLWLIHEIDPQMLLKKGGYSILATRQLLFFHPRYMLRLLENDPSALVEAPLKLVIMEMPDGQVILRHPDIAASFARYARLKELGSELSDICARLLATVS